MSPKEYPAFGSVAFCHHIASGHAWQSWVKDFGIFVFPFGVIFHQPAFLECLSLVYLENSSWQHDKLSEFHQLFFWRHSRIVREACPSGPRIVLRSAHPVWSSLSHHKDFQTLTLQPYECKSWSPISDHSLEEERIKDLFIDVFALCRSGFILVFVGFAYILGILKENTKMAKPREINLLLLMFHGYELWIGVTKLPLRMLLESSQLLQQLACRSSEAMV